MADFNVNLSGPQASGAGAIQPVQERTIPEDHSLLNGIVDIFAKGLEGKRKDDANSRKAAVMSEYINNEKVYTDALTTGQWNASQVGMASRANFTKILASYPEYTTELMEAKRAVYDGTEVGEAQKEMDRAVALRENDKKRASEAGYVFYAGMGEKAENTTLDAFKYSQKAKEEMEEIRKRQADDRAANAEDRSQATHNITIQEHKDKETATRGLVMVADRNLSQLSETVTDLMANPTMSFEAKLMVHKGNVNRIKQGLLSVAATNPAMAAPWQKLVDDIDMTAEKMLDPKAKATGELDALKNQYDTLIYQAKLATITNPKLLKFVIASDLFKDPAQITLHGSAVIGEWLAGTASGDPSYKPTPVVGTDSEKGALRAFKGALSNLNSGKVADKEKATKEAVNVANELMKQTTKVDGSISPSALKELSSFYSSSEFGTLAATGKIDMKVMQQAKQVFQVGYEPAVRQAIVARLGETIQRSPGRDGANRGQPVQTMLETIDIKFSGAGVEFVDKKGSSQTLYSSFDRRGLDVAKDGLNTLIRMGAHMEGTTDYGKYWEANKHYLLPTVFPDPAKLKVGDKIDGFEYTGGAYSDRSNWKRVK